VPIAIVAAWPKWRNWKTKEEPNARLEQDAEEVDWVLQRLSALSINIDKVTQQLKEEGVERFNRPFDELTVTLAKTCSQNLRRKPRRRFHCRKAPF